MKRFFDRWPGYDCVRGLCPHDPLCKGGQGGIHAEQWRFGIRSSDGLTALTLSVSSGVYPSTVPDRVNKTPAASDLSLHTTFPTSTEQILAGAAGCDAVIGGSCFTYCTTILGAQEFFWQHGFPAFMQPESFWKALQAKFAELDKAARAARVDQTHARCPTCVGTGVTARDTGPW